MPRRQNLSGRRICASRTRHASLLSVYKPISTGAWPGCHGPAAHMNSSARLLNNSLHSQRLCPPTWQQHSYCTGRPCPLGRRGPGNLIFDKCTNRDWVCCAMRRGMYTQSASQHLTCWPVMTSFPKKFFQNIRVHITMAYGIEHGISVSMPPCKIPHREKQTNTGANTSKSRREKPKQSRCLQEWWPRIMNQF